MAKFKIEVTRVDEYEIEVDETIYDQQALKNWSQTFWDVDSAQELAESLAETVARNGAGRNFMEGFGTVKTYYSDGSEKTQYTRDFKRITEFTPGLSIRIISEDDDISTETKKNE